jgi:hypothetical protein
VYDECPPKTVPPPVPGPAARHVRVLLEREGYLVAVAPAAPLVWALAAYELQRWLHLAIVRAESAAGEGPPPALAPALRDALRSLGERQVARFALRLGASLPGWPLIVSGPPPAVRASFSTLRRCAAFEGTERLHARALAFNLHRLAG